jgi:chromosomal replication initiator protein
MNQDDVKKIWHETLLKIESSISKANFTTWFKDTDIVKFENGIIFVGVQNAFVRDWLSSKYHKTILDILTKISESIRGLEFMVVKSGDLKKNKEPQELKVNSFVGQMTFQEFYVDPETNLNPKYTFQNFVVGSFNELAYTAAQAIIKKPGQSYNPLFVYGNTGHGKTHLIQAVGNEIKNSQPGKKVYYLTSEKFSIDFINSIQGNKLNIFKEKYRKYDVLIMDDIQFLATKEKTQEELFHLFNALYDSGKQILFSSDKHPNFIQGLEDRLRSRFEAGLIVDIPAPDTESRLAIIKSKMNTAGVFMPDNIIEYIASSIDGNIREIEGFINSLVCQINLKKRELTLNEIKNLLKTNIKPKKTVSIKDIVKVVADFYNTQDEEIYKKTRRKEIVKPRQVAMFILREDCNLSFPLIGEKLGGRDHTTVIHSCEKIKEEIKNNPNLEKEIEQIRALL